MRNTKPFQAWKRDSHMKFHRFQSHHLQDVEITRTTTTPPDTVTLSEVIDALNKTTELLYHNFSDLEYVQDRVRKNKAILNKHGGNNA